MELSIEAQRIKTIRESLKMTQIQFAEELGIKSTSVEMERGRTRITGEVVMQLLEKYNVNPLWLYGRSKKKHLNPNHTDVIPKVISINAEGNENIVLVNAKASAGYGSNLGDEQYYEKLPTFNLPLPEYRNSSFRGFQIVGDSMLPLVQTNDWVLGEAVSSIDDIKNGDYYIIVEDKSIRLKKIEKLNNELKLISLNPDYVTTTVLIEDIVEIWKYHSKISFGTSDAQSSYTIENLYKELQDIKKKLK
jgi:transcriptional regulator with XRE-family HTH domain